MKSENLMDLERITICLKPYLLKAFDSMVKVSGVNSRSEAFRVAIRDWINSELKKIPMTKVIKQIAEGELPDFLKNANLDFRTKKDLETLERMLKEIK